MKLTAAAFVIPLSLAAFASSPGSSGLASGTPGASTAQAFRHQPAAACTGSPFLEGYAMAYDPIREKVIVFGGANANDQLTAETWGWDGRSWSCVAAQDANGPSPRSASMMAFDFERKALVLYGGRSGRDGLRDTWELGASGWIRRSTAGPTPDPHGVMAFDATTKAVLLFHSLGDDTPARATWKWNGSEWTRVASGPNQQFPNAMFSSNGSRPAMLVTARSTEKPDAFNAPVYEWRKHRWTPLATTGDAPVFSPQAPAARTIAGAILYAGFEPGGVVSTYLLNGNVWRKYAGESPPRRRGAQMVFDSRRGVAVLHAGSDGSRILMDTWEWNGREWKQMP